MKSTGYKVRFLPLSAFCVEGRIEGLPPEDAYLSLFVDGRLEGHGIAVPQHSDEGLLHGFSIEIPLHLRDGLIHSISLRRQGDSRDMGLYPFITIIEDDPAPESRQAVSRFAGELALANKPVAEEPGIVGVKAPYRARIERAVRGKRKILLEGWAAWPDGSVLGGGIRLRLPGKPPVHVPHDGFHADLVSFAVVLDLNPRAQWPSSILLDMGEKTSELVLPLPPSETAKTAGYLTIGEDLSLYGFCVGLDADNSHADICLGEEFTFRLPLGAIGPGLVFDSQGIVAAHFHVDSREYFSRLRVLKPDFVLEDGILTAVLLADSEVRARSSIRMTSFVRLQVEQALPERLAGWMVDSRANRMAELDVLVDGVRLRTIRADRHRQDVIAAGLTDRGGGFQVVPAVLGTGRHEWRFAHPFTRQFVGGALPIIVTDRPSPLRNLCGLTQDWPPVTVVIALKAPSSHAAVNLLRLRASTEARLLVLAVPGTEVSVDGIECHVMETPSIQAALALAGADDLMWIDGLPEVGPGWLYRIRLAAYSDSRMATVTPLSDRGPFAVPECGQVNILPEGLDFNQMSRRVHQAAAATYPRVTAGNPYCIYLRRDALLKVPGVEEDGDLTRFFSRTGRAGFIHAVDDRTIVGCVNAVTEPDVPESDVMAAVRWRIRRALQFRSSPKPRILYVISTQGGGTPQTNRDLMDAVGDCFEPWLLTSDARTLELYRLQDGELRPIDKITLETPVTPLFHTSPDYDDWIAQALAGYAFEVVHIRHLGWHGTGLPRIARRLGIPVVLSIHDYYMACPNTKLLDPENVYCGGLCTAGTDDCAVELWPQSDFPRLRGGFVQQWRETFADVLAACDVLVTTSESVRAVFRRLYPTLQGADFRIIPHGRRFPEMTRLAVAPSPNGPLKILVPGNISPAKGADLINALAALDTGGIFEFHMLGDSGWIVPSDSVVRHGAYERKDFGRRVAAIAPHIGMVPSLCPETFCHTLTEMWASGVPVAGLDLGAVGERIRAHQAGWLLPANGDVEEIYETLAFIREDFAGWQLREQAVGQWQAGEGVSQDTAWMGGQYEALYQPLLKLF